MIPEYKHDIHNNNSLLAITSEKENESIFNRQEIECTINSLGNYMHLMRQPVRRIFAILYTTRRKRRNKRMENTFIASLKLFFDFVEELQLFLDVFDSEYKSHLDSQIEIEEGEAYTLWHDICDLLDAASTIHKSVLALLQCLDTFARSFTLHDKQQAIVTAKCEFEQLQANLKATLLICEDIIEKNSRVVSQNFANCAAEMNLVKRKLDLTLSITSFKQQMHHKQI